MKTLLILCLIALLAVQCAPVPAATPVPEAEVPPTAAPAEKITVVHWQHHHEARAKIVQELADEFTATNPNIQIDFESVPYDAYFDKLVTSLEAGSGPDVFQIPANIAFEFFRRGQLAPVPAEVMTTEAIESSFVGWTVELLKFEGQYYGLPTDVQTFLLFINNALFEEAGLDPSKGPETWDEFTEYAVKLTKRDANGNLIQAGVDLGSPYQWYWSLPLQTIDQGFVDPETLKVTYNSSGGYRAWQFLTDLVVKYHVDSPEFLAEQQKFVLGKAAMNLHEYVYAGTLKLQAPDLKFTIHFPPHPKDRPLVIGGTYWTYVVSSQSKHPAEAWKWVKFLTSTEAQRKWVAGGGELPSRQELIDDPQLRADPNVAKALDSMQYAKVFNGIGWDDVWYIHQAIYDNIVLKGMDVKTAVDQGAQEEEALYQKKLGH
ncbi:MAG TPA: ABC transporter substrate-binding protein [Anaerolineae bacterium]|nr:ABC transporter substrate-binding protein [Anaerolineae bacterium]